MSRQKEAIRLLIPDTAAWVYTAEAGWHIVAAPPSWWIDEQSLELAPDLAEREEMADVHELDERRAPQTSCRPGTARGTGW